MDDDLMPGAKLKLYSTTADLFLERAPDGSLQITYESLDHSWDQETWTLDCARTLMKALTHLIAQAEEMETK